MVKSDEVLVGQGRLVEVSCWVYIVKRWLPLLLKRNDDVPETGEAVDVDDDDKD